MSQDNFSQSSNASHGTTNEAQQVLDVFWEREMDEIRNLGQNDFKSQELPLARIKKIMKLDEDVKMISAEAPVLFAKAAELFITELSLRAWVHTEDNKRRTLQRNDIAMAITKYDQFDFLIDIVPREELKPPKRAEENVRTATMHPDQVQYYFQLAQQHQAALQQQQTSGVSQQGQQTQIQQAQPQQKINYGNNGKKALKKHADDKVHQRNFPGLQCASLFPGSKQVCENVTLSLNDRGANQKVVLPCFVAENSLPFPLTPKLVELCQTLTKDRPALSKLKMERTAATYITGHGVAKTMREELVTKLNKNYFSMNVDEATNINGDKIINVLVRVYDDEKEKIITAHLGSIKENISTANHIFLHLKELLDSNQISFSNCSK
ncbi:Nuclear transcription factor Y subunit gamma [Araneus ventricosus]|uniref:Nuclear transcription factor Y subunit gamma n=1 Tax=Araneus ventricosus TaxID=182803 RepID=A0A4Y2M369_ARAVE|nr:Nuclear transcription factor Y subunit gamma [Araneus ventricosus]